MPSPSSQPAPASWDVTAPHTAAYAGPRGVKRVAILRLRGMAGPLRARVSWPSSADARPALLVFFAHPGRLEEAAAVADALCAEAEVVVLAATCWLTPNDGYPVVLDRAAATITWVADHAADLSADRTRIAVGGYRRGAAVAAAMALRARDRGWPRIARQVLIQPDFGPEPTRLYGTEASLHVPLSAVSLAGVAPASIATAGDGPLADHGRRYAARLRRAGVDVDERHYPGDGPGAAPEDDESADALADLAQSLRHAVGAPRGEREAPAPVALRTSTDHQPEGVEMTASISADPGVGTQTYRLYIKASPEAVWEALTTAELARQYGYGTPVEYDLSPGGAYRSLATDEMKQYGTPDVLIDGEVIEVDAPRRLVHTSRILWDAEAQAEGFTKIAFDLEGREDGVTKLTVTHDVAGAPRTAAQIAGDLPEGGGGWNEILSGLKTLLETGRPLAG